ncbi:MAG: class I SAM-dependent methyltransferase [Candidatus Altiarchaeia archaeon]
MTKTDNASAHAAVEYDSQIRRAIPYYDCFHEETISLIKAVVPEPENWLDTGCGTGSLVEKAAEVFPKTRFVLADPSFEMLSVARGKLKLLSGRIRVLDPCGTQDISLGDEKFVVVSAVQSHHYLSNYERAKATKVCFDLLRAGGVYVTFENIRPASGKGIEIAKDRWRNYQTAARKDAGTVEKHLNRFGVKYFPITVDEHLSLLRKAGFSVVELLWYSCMQAGFYAIK